MRLAIIPARGGSKRILKKNIRDFCGKPIIAYSIISALDSGCFDEVMVSTDDNEIAAIAKEWGATVPFMRTEHTATDTSTTAEALLEVLADYQKKGVNPSSFCCIYPTAPFITPLILNKSYALLVENEHVDVVMPIVRFSYPIQRALRLVDNRISLLQSEHLLSRSQDLESTYHDAGQFYWCKTKEFIETGSLIPLKSAGLVIPEWQAQDIDNDNDWTLAQIKFNYIRRGDLNYE